MGGISSVNVYQEGVLAGNLVQHEALLILVYPGSRLTSSVSLLDLILTGEVQVVCA